MSLHTEGCATVYAGLFGSSWTPKFAMGLTGINVPNDKDWRPHHTNRTHTPRWWKLDRDTKFAELVGNYWATEGGAADGNSDGTHAEEMGYLRKAVTFSVTEVSDAVHIIANEVSFTNNIILSPIRNPEDYLLPDSYYRSKDYFLNNVHGYPWDIPTCQAGIWNSEYSFLGTIAYTALWTYTVTATAASWTTDQWVGYRCYAHGCWGNVTANTSNTLTVVTTVDSPSLGEHGDASKVHTLHLRQYDATIQELETDILKGESLPIGAAYVVTDELNPKLVASHVFIDAIRLKPGTTLKITYSMRLRNYKTTDIEPSLSDWLKDQEDLWEVSISS